MSIESYLQKMPKVELHVHLEGSIQPETLLKLAKKNKVDLPANTVEGLRNWYTFTNFDHFIEIYIGISSCIRSVEDIELIARDFIAGQAAQNIIYSEVTYTAYTHFLKNISFHDQIEALNRAKSWGEKSLGVKVNWVIDISRNMRPEDSLLIADWVIEWHNKGVVALGLGGPEVGYPPELFAEAFDRVQKAGVPSVPHAGETMGPESIWGALHSLNAVRIGHGVRCLEDLVLVKELKKRQIPLEVCPTSNLCLHVVPSLEEHPLKMMLSEGLYVTINSDDPPMFNTSLNNEYQLLYTNFNLTVSQIEQLVLNAAHAALLPPDEKMILENTLNRGFISEKAKSGL